jgi:hypothetical protein
LVDLIERWWAVLGEEAGGDPQKPWPGPVHVMVAARWVPGALGRVEDRAERLMREVQAEIPEFELPGCPSVNRALPRLEATT